MSAFQNPIRDDICALDAYHVQPAKGMIKLDAMENPYGLPQQIKDEIASITANAEINRYPDPSANQLTQQIREIMNIPDNMELLLGNGSDEIIQIIAMAVAKPGAVLLAPTPSFVMFRMIAIMCGLQFVGVDLNEDFSLNETAMLDAVQNYQPAVTFLAYPNNPTGNLFDADIVNRIIEKSPGLVVIDEAYFAFSPSTFVSRLGQFPNLLVMRTVSKLGLAGLRLGLLAGPKAIVNELHKIKLPYNINVLTQQVASCVLKNYALLRGQVDDICAQRTWLFDQLKEMKSLEIFKSDANFILFRALNANELFEGLKRHGILIKNVNSSHSLLSNCLRVTVGSHKENEKFVDVMRKLTDKS